MLLPFRYVDRQFCLAVGLLLFVGITTLYSLSFIAKAHFSYSHFVKHCIYLVGALGVFATLLQVPINSLRKKMYWVLGLALLLSFFTLFSDPIKGARRWISIFGVSLQVSEVLKFAALLAFACWGKLSIENNALRKQVLRPLIPLAVFGGIVLVLTIVQKDLGTVVLLAVTGLLVLILAGIPKRYVFLLGVLAVLVIILLVGLEGHRQSRITAFIDPFADPHGAGFAQLQSLMAYNNGGLFGVGWGGSLQKESLPEVHNDFIIAIIAEEHGWLGFFFVCALYLFIGMRMISIGKVANKRGELFGAFYAYLLAGLILTQVMINVGGSTAALPSKGLTLPLLSYGGSSLWATAAMFAVLLRLDYENKLHAEAVQ